MYDFTVCFFELTKVDIFHFNSKVLLLSLGLKSSRVMKLSETRVRFAPSPTGPLHIGGVRTALYNYLFARNRGGKFILRIEDTDQNRYVEGAEEYIMEALEWTGLVFDEGVKEGGPFGPYRQSERKDIYRAYADELVNKGYAYYAFDTPEELELMRQKLEEEKAVNTSYGCLSRMGMTNSLTLSAEETQQRITNGETYVIRYKMKENEEVEVTDQIRGKVVVNTHTLDDKVLFKSDGMPTYHLANVVDDYLMKISHVIRGEEWLPSLPLHVMLYRSFEWEEPEFAHLPLLLKPDGKGKLSKRDGDRLGFPVFPLQWEDPKTKEIATGYRESGYFPEAFINILAFLGWNPGTEKEMFNMDELIENFSLERVGKSGSRFDVEKARWFNHHYLIQHSNSELAALFATILKEKDIRADEKYIVRVVGLVKERANFVSELWDQSFFFFNAPDQYDETVVKKKWKDTTPALMTELIEVLEQIEEFTSETCESKVKNWIAENEYGMGAVMTAFRLCVVGELKGPHMFDIIELLGKEETIKRLKNGINMIR